MELGRRRRPTAWHDRQSAPCCCHVYEGKDESSRAHLEGRLNRQTCYLTVDAARALRCDCGPSESTPSRLDPARRGDSNCFGGVPVVRGRISVTRRRIWTCGPFCARHGRAMRSQAAESKTRVATPVETVRSTLATFAWRGEAVAMMRAMPGCRLWPGAWESPSGC